jgi:FKBP-type peptidyl-prolyl cis-trans isomerase
MNRIKFSSLVLNSLAIIFAAFGLTACLGEDPFEKQRKEDETKVKAYVSARNLQGFFTTSGLYIDTVTLKDATVPLFSQRVTAANIVEISYKLYDLTGTNGLFLTGSNSYTFLPQSGSFFAGLNEGILSLRKGQKAILVLPSLLALGTNTVTVGSVVVPAGSPLRMEVTVLDVRTPAQQETVEAAAINARIAAANHPSTAIRRDIEGVVIIRTARNATGDTIVSNDNLKVSYIGRRLDGTEFDKGTDLSVLISPQANLIKGFVTGLSAMRIGEKGFIYIPSSSAYGATGSQGKIAPYTPLVFEITNIIK